MTNPYDTFIYDAEADTYYKLDPRSTTTIEFEGEQVAVIELS
jgi:hypothetical protein